MKSTTSKRVQVTGRIERVSVLRDKPFYDAFRRYSSNSERYEIRLDIALRLEDGSAVYFKTPPAKQTITSCPGAAVVCFYIDGEAKKWMHAVGDIKVATPGTPNENHIEALVHEGETITVEGTIKTQTVSKQGNPYTVINRVKQIN